MNLVSNPSLCNFLNYLCTYMPCIISCTFKKDLFPDDTPVPVANCNAKEYNSNPKQIMPFKEFIQYWREYIQNGHSSPKGCLYLKDWHMHRYCLYYLNVCLLFFFKIK